MKDYSFYLWAAYLATAVILAINLALPLLRYYRLMKKKKNKYSINL